MGQTLAPLRTPQGIERIDDPTARAAFSTDADSAGAHVPHAVLRPRSTDDLLALTKWANQSGVGIVPVSSTGPRRRGDTVPARRDTVVADLSGMRRLVHADGRDKIVILEPGVDFGNVDRLLQPHGLRALRPLAPRAGKSVIASHLEREPLIAANDHWDTADPFGGTNVVLGNGRWMPTGTAATEGTLEQQLAHGNRQMVAAGPTHIDPLRVLQGAQGSLGMLAWAAVYCERIPTAETAWFASAQTLAPVIDLTRELLHRRLGNALFVVDSVQLALLLARDAAGFRALAGRLPAWTLFASLSAGARRTADKMAWQTADLREQAARFGVRLDDALVGHTAQALAERLRMPEPVSFRDRPLGAHKALFFLQQLPRVADFVPIVRDTLVTAGVDAGALGVYVQPMTQGVNCHIEFTLPCAPAVAHGPLDDAWQLAARRCSEAGGFFSRPYGRWAEFAFGGDRGTRSLMTLAKTIFDPNGVMNPGRLPY